MIKLRPVHLILGVHLSLVAAVAAHATNLTVNCQAKKNNSIQAALNSLGKQGPHTISVSGNCTEIVAIQDFDNLTLLTTTGASIIHPPADPEELNYVLSIADSRSVTVEGFTINGGVNGIACVVFSSCRLRNNTVQGAADFGIVIGRASSAELVGNTIQNSVGGLQLGFGGAEAVVFGGTIQTITGAPAADVSIGALLRLVRNGPGGPPVVIENNMSGGINVSLNSTLFLGANSTRILSNGGDGITLDGGSVAEIRGLNEIKDNTGIGVRVGESSFASVSAAAVFSENGGDVVCAGTFSNAKGQFPCSNPSVP